MHFALSLRIFICSVLLLFFKQAFSQKNDNNIQYESFEGIVSKAELNDEIKEKRQQVQQFLSNEKLEGILLSKNNNFSWITAGIGDNHILITSAIGDASVLIMKGGKKYLLANNTEVAHLMEEDLKGLGYEAKGYDWFDGPNTSDKKMAIIKKLSGGKTIGSDIEYGDLKVIEGDFAPLRYQLTPAEIKKYKWVGQQATEAVTATAKLVKPGMTEREMETILSNELMNRGLRPTVLLIGSDERLLDYYHYPPTDKKLQKYVFLNLCARKWGLVASVGRYVYFGDMPADLKKSMKASATISANMQAATKQGAKASEIFEQTKQWYARQGYADYWKYIHVGGGISYNERDWLASSDSKEVVHNNQAFAWNPFTQRALSFDTFILTKDGIVNITKADGWPVIPITVNGKVYDMPDILTR